jgi:antitoxin component YwqK of YwqJK toxin-antitoxin module
MAFRRQNILLCLVIAMTHHAFSQPVEIRIYHDPNDAILKEVYFVDDSVSAKLCGLYKSYFISGTLEKQGFYRDNLPDSLWTYYYESGGLKMQGMLKDGASHGLWEYYFENGNLNMAGMIIDSKREGNWKYYYENGQIKSQGEYKNNESMVSGTISTKRGS